MVNQIQTKKIKNIEVPVSIVGLGTFAIGGWFWGGTSKEDAIKAINASLDEGINLIDTAPIYGYGLSEKIIGEAIKGRREEAIIATKCGLVWDKEQGVFHAHADDMGPKDKPSKYKIYQYLAPRSIRDEIEASLKRLDTDYIDLYQTHWQDSTTPIDDTMEELLKLKDQGKIKAIGVSNVNMEQLKEYNKTGDISSAQEKFSLIDRKIEKNGILEYCISNKIAILSYFTMEQGLLTGKMSPSRVFPEGDTRSNNPSFQRQNIQRINEVLNRLIPFTKKYNIELVQLIIALTAAQKGITHVLIGSRNEKQAKENAIGGRIKLAEEDISEMNKIVKELG